MKKILFILILFSLFFLLGCILPKIKNDVKVDPLPKIDNHISKVLLNSCGNNICDSEENKITCPQDCLIKKNKTEKCNYNNLCEGFEGQSCSDCQCLNGVVCNGLCFNNLNSSECFEGVLFNSEFIGENSCKTLSECPKEKPCKVPGECESFNLPLKVSFNLPQFLELGQETKGKIIFYNTFDSVLKQKIRISLYDLQVKDLHGKDFNLLNEVTVNANDSLEFDVIVVPLKLSDSVGFDSLDKVIMNIELESSQGEEFNSPFRFNAFVFDKKTALKCGENYWNFSGVCVGEIFFPSANCSFGKNCIDKESFWDFNKRDVLANGKKSVAILSLNLPLESKNNLSTSSINLLFEDVNNWFEREAIRYTKQKMLSFEPKFFGNFELSLNENSFEWGARNFLQEKLKIDLNKFDFVLIVLPSLPKTDLGEAAGYYYGNGDILLLDSAALNEETVVHELTHGFGCKDLYEKKFLCNYHWNRSLLCAGAWIAGDLLSTSESSTQYLSDRVLGNCAAEIGWSDVDNDEIIDLVDENISTVIPNEFTGIAFKDLNYFVTQEEFYFLYENYNYGMGPGTLAILGKLVDSTTNSLIAGKVSVKDLNSMQGDFKCLDEDIDGIFFCRISPEFVSNTITLQAEFEGFKTEQVIQLK